MRFLTFLDTAGQSFSEIATGIDFSQILQTYLLVAGIALPVVVSIYATKKGFRWLIGFIKKA